MDPIASTPGLRVTLASSDASAPDPIRESAKAFEAVFIKQMLQYAGLADAFGVDDSSPVASFSDFVLEQIADDMVDQGGFGLADQFYSHLKAQADDDASADATAAIRL